MIPDSHSEAEKTKRPKSWRQDLLKYHAVNSCCPHTDAELALGAA
jgi:hypothetical protein